MYIDGAKIKSLISTYGKNRGYPEKSYTAMFCKDFELNYNQWNAYTRGAQVIGPKITQKLMEVFPNLNLNWFFKEDQNMFVGEKTETVTVKEPEPVYQKEITPEDIFYKMEEMLIELKALNKKKV